MENKKNFYKRFAAIQKQLKVPKEKINDFGKYNYRKAEDILSALKDCLEDGECVFLDNEIKFIEGRFYSNAIAIFTNGEFEIKTQAQAREEDIKKGMDASQITGSATSYARKYALAGLFGIDNEKDADSNDNNDKEIKKPTTQQNPVIKTSPSVTVDEMLLKINDCKTIKELRMVWTGFIVVYSKDEAEKQKEIDLLTKAKDTKKNELEKI